VIHFTGERVVPGQVNDDLWAEHYCRYAFASQYAQGRHALDVGSGTGYGTAELARTARQAVGLEISVEATRYADSNYHASNLTYTTGSATQLPFAPERFDLITAFEIIEHLEHWKDLLAEARRVIQSRGLFLVSTPNKLYYNESRAPVGPNIYHVHEFEFAEFRDALREFFPHVTILQQNHVNGFAIYQGQSAPVIGVLANKVSPPEDAHFFLAVCSQTALPPIQDFVYIPRAANVLREREHHIQSLERQLAGEREARNEHVAALEAQLSQERNERQRHIQSLQNELAGVIADYKTLENDRDEKRLWAEGLNAELQLARHAIDKAKAEVGKAKAEVDKAETTVIERTGWVQQLENTRWTRLGRKLGFLPRDNYTSLKKDS
jgi:ubiquinone/menaquinone biosynthesis C-methylase UbiE